MRAMNWFILNVMVFTWMYLGFYKGIYGATNLALVFGWLAFLCSPFAHTKASIARIRNDGPVVPLQFSRATTMLKVIGFVWFGHIVTGTVFAFGWLIVEAAVERAQRLAGPDYRRALAEAAELHRHCAESCGHESLVSAFVAGADWERHCAEAAIISNKRHDRDARMVS